MYKPAETTQQAEQFSSSIPAHARTAHHTYGKCGCHYRFFTKGQDWITSHFLWPSTARKYICTHQRLLAHPRIILSMVAMIQNPFHAGAERGMWIRRSHGQVRCVEFSVVWGIARGFD